MLENEPDNNPSTTGAEAPSTPQPRRRRAASRPAGPPASASDTPTIVVTAPEASSSATQAAVEPLAPSPEVEDAPIAEASPVTEGETSPVAKTAKRAPAKRATRKSAAKKATSPAAEDELSASTPAAGEITAVEIPAAETPLAETSVAEIGALGAGSTETASTEIAGTETDAPPRTRAPRKRAAKKTAATPGQDPLLTAEPSAAAQSAALDAHAPEQIPGAGVEVRTAAEADQPVPDGDEVVAVTIPERTSPEAPSGGQPVPDLVEDEDEDEDDELTARTKRLWADPFSVPSGGDPSTRAPEPSAPEPGAPSIEPPTSTDDSNETDQSDDEDADESDSAEESDSESDADSSPRRRRRRRGGRRHRRGGGDEDSADDDSDETSGDDSGTGGKEPDAVVAAGPDQSDAGAEDSTDSDDDESDGQRRRRRRRRRRGEDSTGAADDPTEVVVRVREPRARKKPSTEVTGIEGSTRMEAKRQRRRDGREAGRRRAPILSEAEFLARREAVARKMIIRQHEDLSQIAVTEDDILVEHYVDRDSATSLIGNVYLGRVQNVLPSMEAAFIDIGRGRNAVLYAGEVDWDSFGAEGHNRKVEKVLKSGQTILVQVSKDPVGAKGARLTNHVSIPGRYIVYAPGGHLSGISRKLPENERRRLKDILADLVGESASVIVRTAAEGASEDELVRDVNRLKAQWEDIESKVKAGNAPQQLYGEPDLTVRIVRDLFTEDFSELVIQGNGLSNDAYDSVDGYVSHVAPHLQERLRRWDAEQDGDIFAAHRLDEQIAKALERKVFLPSGGSLIIERTEAMTVIDVNTGKFTGTGGNLEATVTSNNLEAAEEIVRQLRLRDIGGIIVIDFIDMVLPNNRELLLRRLVECLGRDRTRHQVAEVTSLGLVQMTRKKIGTGLIEAFSTECPHCHGRGVELHDMPVDTQKQADGGTRDPRPRDHRRGQNNGSQSNGSQNSGSQQDGDQGNGRQQRSEDVAAASGGDGASDKSGSDRSSRSRRGRRGRGGSSNDPSSQESSSAEQPQDSRVPEVHNHHEHQDHPEGVPLS